MLVDILDQHLSPINANLWASLGRSDCHLWHFARPPHRLALGTHQQHPYDAADQNDDPTDHEAGVETVKRWRCRLDDTADRAIFNLSSIAGIIFRFANDSPLEGTGFEPSVPL
jgi:hypothetical protein